MSPRKKFSKKQTKAVWETVGSEVKTLMPKARHPRQEEIFIIRRLNLKTAELRYFRIATSNGSLDPIWVLNPDLATTWDSYTWAETLLRGFVLKDDESHRFSIALRSPAVVTPL